MSVRCPKSTRCHHATGANAVLRACAVASVERLQWRAAGERRSDRIGAVDGSSASPRASSVSATRWPRRADRMITADSHRTARQSLQRAGQAHSLDPTAVSRGAAPAVRSLTGSQLSTDVYDELLRRKVQDAGRPEAQPFLPVQDSFHPCADSAGHADRLVNATSGRISIALTRAASTTEARYAARRALPRPRIGCLLRARATLSRVLRGRATTVSRRIAGRLEQTAANARVCSVSARDVGGCERGPRSE